MVIPGAKPNPQRLVWSNHARSLFDLSLIQYPTTVSLPSDGLVRNPAHSDFGTLTLLFRDAVGRLEIADTSSTNSEISARVERSGECIHIDPKPGTGLVNVGYLLMRWSNGRWKNTIHRVSEPPLWKEQGLQGSKCNDTGDRSNDSGKLIPERYCTAYCSSPDPATVVEPLPRGYGDQLPRRWKPINAGEYLRRKRAAMYAWGVWMYTLEKQCDCRKCRRTSRKVPT